MKDKEKNVIQELAEQAEQNMKYYEQAFQTGLKMQEEAGQWGRTLLRQTATAQEWQKRYLDFASVTNRVMPAAQKRMEEMLDLTTKNVQTGTQLFKKAVEAAQTPIVAESQAKWMDFWNSSMAAAQANAEAMTQMNIRTIESWIGLVQKNIKATESQAA